MTASPNPSLQKKTAARLSAVQCLYACAITGEVVEPALQAAKLKTQLQYNHSEQKLRVGVALEPNYALLESLLNGVAQWRADIDARLDSCLSGDWSRARMSPLLIAIFQCAIFELFFYKDTGAKIIIDEYTRLTRSFFTDNDVHFVHGALASLVARYASPPNE